MPTIKLLTNEIRAYFTKIRIGNVKRAATGPNGNIWNGVKRAKNLVKDEIPSNLTLGGRAVAVNEVANSFAKHFSDKVKSFVRTSNVDANVYNGRNKLIVVNRNFMKKLDVKECLNSLPNKKCEGFDRIPVCILKDSKDLLLDPLTHLFSNIFKFGVIPEQWKVSKIVPIFKKGNKSKLKITDPLPIFVVLRKSLKNLFLNKSSILNLLISLTLQANNNTALKKRKVLPQLEHYFNR